MTVVTDVVHRVEQFVVQVERDVVEFVLVLRKLYGVLMWLMPRNMGFLVVVQVEQQVVVQVEQQLSQLFTTSTSSVQVEQQVVVVVQVVGKLYLAGAAHSTQLGPRYVTA